MHLGVWWMMSALLLMVVECGGTDGSDSPDPVRSTNASDEKEPKVEATVVGTGVSLATSTELTGAAGGVRAALDGSGDRGGAVPGAVPGGVPGGVGATGELGVGAADRNGGDATGSTENIEQKGAKEVDKSDPDERKKTHAQDALKNLPTVANSLTDNLGDDSNLLQPDHGGVGMEQNKKFTAEKSLPRNSVPGAAPSGGVSAPLQGGDRERSNGSEVHSDTDPHHGTTLSRDKLEENGRLGKMVLKEGITTANTIEPAQPSGLLGAPPGTVKNNQVSKAHPLLPMAEDTQHPSTEDKVQVKVEDGATLSKKRPPAVLAENTVPEKSLGEPKITTDVPLLGNTVESQVLLKYLPQPTEDIPDSKESTPDRKATLDKVDKATLPTPASNALPVHNSVDKTDGSLGSSSLFALAALATLAVAAAAPAH